MGWVSIWWEALTLTEQVLFCIALPSSLILIIQAVLIIAGAGGDIDGGLDTDTGGDFDGSDGSGSSEFGIAGMFTLQGVASFFCVFGWVSIFAYRSGLPLILAALIAAVLGLATMFAIAKVMMYLTRLAHSGTLDVKNLLGSMGTVYLKIPAKGSGKGKVMVQTSERFVEFDAVSEVENEIPNNAQVRVIDILGENVLVVERQ